MGANCSAQTRRSSVPDDVDPVNMLSEEGGSQAAGLREQPPLAPGMDAVHLNQPLVATSLAEIKRLGASKCFVMANRSSTAIPAVAELIAELEGKGMLAAPLCTSIVMGGAEAGVLEACNAAKAVGADCIITIGGGAIHDAGKLLRMWLSAAGSGEASVAGIQAAALAYQPKLPPQIAAPNSFAMAELTHVAGLTKTDNSKGGAAHPSMMPTSVIFDPALLVGLPEWVRFGTALRCVEHAVGAVCSPAATDEVREQALVGLAMTSRGLRAMIADPDAPEGQTDVYVGGWYAIRALNSGCYPALGHLTQNHYSAKFGVHQGSCSGILCARIMAHHKDVTEALQARIAATLGSPDVSAPRAVSDLVAQLPGVAKDHAEASIMDSELEGFATWMFENHGERLNQLSPKPFASAAEVLAMLAKPLSAI